MLTEGRYCDDQLGSRIAAFRKVSLLPKFLDARILSRYLLDTKAGNFDKTDLIDFLTKCNKEMVPPNIHTNILNDHETCTRFQLSFIGQNRNLMVATLIECNNWMHKLWRSPDDGIYESLELFWRNGRITRGRKWLTNNDYVLKVS